jgi:hypothetical protein
MGNCRCIGWESAISATMMFRHVRSAQRVLSSSFYWIRGDDDALISATSSSPAKVGRPRKTGRRTPFRNSVRSRFDDSFSMGVGSIRTSSSNYWPQGFLFLSRRQSAQPTVATFSQSDVFIVTFAGAELQPLLRSNIKLLLN